jgi:hypothetical protein
MEMMRRVEFKLIDSDPERPAVQYRDRRGVHKVELIASHLNLNAAEIEVFREKKYTYILSWNLEVPYAGIEKYLGDAPKGDLFLHSREAIEKKFGRQVSNISPMAMAINLSRYFVDTSEEAERQRKMRRK